MSNIGHKEAVYLFAEQEIAHGFWLSEFERTVRDQQPLPGFVAEGKIKAAYVVIGAQDFAQAMVLFQLPVNERGLVDSGWYLPLKRLADSAGRGPNMGDGRIRLCCQSQCAISWHQGSMWEPVTSDFMAIRKAIRDNLIGSKPLNLVSDTSLSHTSVSTADGLALASAMSKKHNDPEVEQLKQTLRAETLAYRNQLQQLQQEIERQKSLAEKARRQLGDDALQQELDDLRQVHNHEMQSHQQEIVQLVEALEKQKDENERLQLAMQEQKAPAPADEQQVQRLEQKIEEVNLLLQDAEHRSVEQFINRIDALEAVIVCFHPGAGHLTIAADSMLAYSENPTAYAAQKCAVSEESYGAWLDHYDDPKCQKCRVEVPRLEAPQDFQKGIHDHCKLHRSLSAA